MRVNRIPIRGPLAPRARERCQVPAQRAADAAMCRHVRHIRSPPPAPAAAISPDHDTELAVETFRCHGVASRTCTRTHQLSTGDGSAAISFRDKCCDDYIQS